jgi:hypothetical protein
LQTNDYLFNVITRNTVVNPLTLIPRALFSWAMNSRTLIVVTASLLAATIVIGAGSSFKTNNAFAQMMGPQQGMMMGGGHDMMMGSPGGMMGPGMMW